MEVFFFLFLTLGLKVNPLAIAAERSEYSRVQNVHLPKYKKTLKLFWEHTRNFFGAGFFRKNLIYVVMDKYWGLGPNSALGSDSDWSSRFSGMSAQKSQHLEQCLGRSVPI